VARTVIHELVRNNAAYAAAFDKGGLGRDPARRLAVVTCMDARIDAHRILGLHEGDAHVVRNAGGVVTDDVIRSLTISQRLLRTEEIVVVMHTDCGMHGLVDSEFRTRVQSEAGLRPAWATEGFFDLEQALREGLLRLRTNPFLVERSKISGFIYEVETGWLRQVG
jgi:carbonic anhydrase